MSLSKKIKILLQTKADTKGVKSVDGATKKHSRSVKVLGVAYRGLKKTGGVALKGLGAAWKGVGSTMRRVRNIAAGVTVALAGSIREFVSFNKGAAKAWTMMDVGVGKFMKFRKEIGLMAAELGVAKSELAEGWYEALSAGVDENNLTDFLRTASKVSVADGSSISTAINGITTVLNAFQMESSQAEAVTDKMFQTVAKGKTSFGDLAAHISQAAPTASALGVSIDQVLAAVAGMTKQGIPTSTAMMQIRNSMLALNKELGDGWAETMTLQEALEKVARDGGYSAQELSKKFGRMTVAGVLALTGANAKAAAADLNEMRDTAGSLDNAFSKVDGQVGHWPRLWQTIRGYLSDVGEVFDTRLRPLVNTIHSKLSEMLKGDGWSKIMDNLSDRVGKLIVDVITCVQVVLDAISKATVGGAISAAVGALIDFIITGLAVGLMSLKSVVVALTRIMIATFTEGILKLDLPGNAKRARFAAQKKIEQMSPEDMKKLGVPDRLAARLQLIQSGIGSDKDKWSAKHDLGIWAKDNLSQNRAAEIAGRSSEDDIGEAINKVKSDYATGKQYVDESMDSLLTNASNRMNFDFQAAFDRTRPDMQAKFGVKPAPAAFVGPPRPFVGPEYQPPHEYTHHDTDFAGPPAATFKYGTRTRNVGGNVMSEKYVESIKTMEDSLQEFLDLAGSTMDGLQRSAEKASQKMRDIESRSKQFGG